jgi:hypothetical protein
MDSLRASIARSYYWDNRRGVSSRDTESSKRVRVSDAAFSHMRICTLHLQELTGEIVLDFMQHNITVARVGRM